MRAMDKLFDIPNTLPGTLTVIVALLTCHLLFKMGFFLWSIIKEKNQVSEQTFVKLSESLEHNTSATVKLELRLFQIEKDLADIPKLRKDFEKLFIAVKVIAGDQWEHIKHDFLEL
jgi:hypothetical protein